MIGRDVARRGGRNAAPSESTEALTAARFRACAVCVLIVGALSGCGGGGAVAPLGRAPASAPATASGVHRVSAGETVYAIAWRHGLDYRDLARWNGIGEPFHIRPGQVLRLSRPSVLPPVEHPRSSRSARTRPPKRKTATPDTATRSPPRRARDAPATEPPEQPVSAWLWPAEGTVTGRFGAGGGKGIDIEGRSGSAVIAAAPGRVVYSGSGLRGYGKLIIVKHNKRYLSAYAHNERLHVMEGDTVSSGQRIADMGSTDSKTVKLHFEIRRDGKPVDPTRYLPR